MEVSEHQGAEVISSFTGDHFFLSNFFRSPVEYQGAIYPTIEHSFQGSKTTYLGLRVPFQNPAYSANEVKKLGRNISLRSDWEEVKNSIMLEQLRTKFSDEVLCVKLLATGNAFLIEGNIWHDNIWGNCECLSQENPRFGTKIGCRAQGQNRLGNMLMLVRNDLREMHCRP
jgi:ribA/ribD-fused uncharacterized protein